MSDRLKIVIPAAGWATRVRPQTWSKPKPLVGVAGRTILDHLLTTFNSVPDLSGERPNSGAEAAEYVFIVDAFLGEAQIPAYMKEHYPQLKANFVSQAVMRGQSDALWLARDHLSGPMIMCFSDTLIGADFSFLVNEKNSVAWVKSVPDPRRFGVIELGQNGWATRLIEKPTSLENNQVVVGCYYFHEGRELVSAIEEQFHRRQSLKGEYFLTDAINIMLEHGLKMRVQATDVWLDTGTIPAILATNRYLLEHGCSNTQAIGQKDVKINPPVFIHKSAAIDNSTIGPNVSIGADCRITNSHVEDSILESGAVVEAAVLKGSFIGRQSLIQGGSAGSQPMEINIGDNSCVILG